MTTTASTNGDVRPFIFPASGDEIRTLVVNGQPVVHLADCCRGLEHSNPSQAAKMLDDDEKIKIDLRDVSAGETALTFATPATGNATTWFVTEAGFYVLALRSNAPGAKQFRRWVTHEVLPALRRNATTDTAAPAVPTTFAAALRLAADEHEAAAAARAELDAAQPALNVYASWLSSEAVEMTDFAKRIGFTPATRLTAVLRELGVLRKDKRADGSFRNLPTKQWEHAFDIAPCRLANGAWIELARLTPDGQLDVAEVLADNGYDIAIYQQQSRKEIDTWPHATTHRPHRPQDTGSG